MAKVTLAPDSTFTPAAAPFEFQFVNAMWSTPDPSAPEAKSRPTALAPAFVPSSTTWGAPPLSPLITTVSVICGSGDVGWIVPWAAPVNTIVSAPVSVFASRIAWRRLPAPESAMLVTVNVAPNAEGTTNRPTQSATAATDKRTDHRPLRSAAPLLLLIPPGQ